MRATGSRSGRAGERGRRSALAGRQGGAFPCAVRKLHNLHKLHKLRKVHQAHERRDAPHRPRVHAYEPRRTRLTGMRAPRELARLNLARFDLLSIRLALACAHGGKLGSAAAECHLVPAAASRRLRELEGALGAPLFERSARGLAPTAAGLVFVRHATALLGGIDLLQAELADLAQGIARHVRLSASTAAVNQFLPPLLARWAELHPALRIDLDEQVSDEVVKALRTRRADIGIFVEGADPAGLETRVFRRDELVLLLPARHRLAKGRRPIAFAALLDEAWIGLNTGAAVLVQQQQAALAAGRPLRLRMQVRSFDAAAHMVACGLGVALLPRAAIEPIARAMGLATRALAEPWAQRRLLVAVREGEVDGEVRGVVEFLAGAAGMAQPDKVTA